MSVPFLGRFASRRWVPSSERSRSLALVYSGMYTGSIVGLALSPQMVRIICVHSLFIFK